jgi:hypothetical protein
MRPGKDSQADCQCILQEIGDMSQMVQAGIQNQVQISRAPARGGLRRKCDKRREKEKFLQRSAVGSALGSAKPRLHEVQRSPEALDAATPAFKETRFGQDFSQIPVHPAGVQAKLTVNTPGDVFEQEADRVAEEVMRTPSATQSGLSPIPSAVNGVGIASGSVQREPESPDKEGDCTGWERDCESLCRRAARQYWIDIGVSPPPLDPGPIECRNPFRICHLHYKNGLTVNVARSIYGGKDLDVWQTKPNDNTKRNEYSGPICKYRYYCTKKQSTLVLEKKVCYDPRTEKPPTETEQESSPPSTIQRSSTYESNAPEAPSIVQGVLNSPGRALDPETSSFMEKRFGHDFSGVRVHTDLRAAQSARLINARAYTSGSHIVFGEGQFDSARPQSRRLLAHELTHVVQQSRGPASIQRAPAPIGREEGDFRCGGIVCNKQTANNTYPTWAGEFIVDKHCVTQDEGASGNGVFLDMRFKPNENVDADKIAFVQSAQSKSGGKPVSVHEAKGEKEKKTSYERMILEGKPGAGTHIDQHPASRTPLIGMRDVAGKSDIGDFNLSTPPPLSEHGWHYHDKDGALKQRDASMHDCPTLSRKGSVAQEQILETASLAVSGAQKGIFYGSIKWGWKMGPQDSEATGLPIKVVSKDAPSSLFADAAKLWNQKLTSEGKPAIAVPDNMYAAAAESVLWDHPGKRKKIGTLAKGSRVGLMERSDPKHPDWRYVVVVSGTLMGKAGWLKSTEIKQFSGAAFPS